MKTLSDLTVASLLVLIFVGTLVNGNVFDTLGWMAFGIVLRLLWDNRHENIFERLLPSHKDE